MKYKIYRNSELIATVRPEGNLTASIMGEEVATMDFSTSECVEFKMNDRCEIFGNTYFLSKVLREDKVNERLFNYTLEFVGVKYELGKIAYMFPDASNALTLSEFHIMGKPQMMIDLIVRNANRVGSGWSVGVVDDVEARQVDFAEDNCLSALAKITSAFNLEYWVDGDKSVHLTKRVGVSGYSFKYGKAKGLRGIGRVPFEGSNIVTRLYAKGSEKNLGSYRNGQRYLRMPVPFLEKNTEKYGIVEHTQSFPDIYPHRIGKVTEVYDDFLKFKDADIDFDLNEKNEHGTVVLIDGVSAKVNFLTGQLAGYTFEIKQYGYNSSDKIFTLLKNKDEKSLEVPSEHLRPAVGDTYVLTDIIMPQSYVTTAEKKLQEEAQRYLDENCGQRHQYTLIADPIYFGKQNVNIQLGNTVRAIDTDFKVDDNLRVTRLVKDLQNPYNVEFDVAERAVIAHVVRDYVEAEKARTAIVKKERYNAEMARRSWNFAREISDNIFDQDGYFDSEKIKPLSIDTSLLTVGSRSQQFELPNVLLTVEENDTAVRNTAGQIVHLTIADKPRKWEIPANVQRGIGSGYHFIYVKAQKEGENASIYVSDEQLPVDGEDFYYFLAGSLGSIDNGFRRIKTAYGFSQVSPGEITTGRISSPNGQNYIELLQDRINIKARVDFESDSPAFNQMSENIKPEIDEAVSNIKIGGRNLMRDSESPIFYRMYGATVTTTYNFEVEEWDTNKAVRQQITGGKNDLRALIPIGVIPDGEIRSLSFYVKNLKNEELYFYSNHGGISTIIPPLGIERVKWEGIEGNGRSVLQIQCRTENADFAIWRINFEESNIVSSWKPAVEDVQKEIQEAKEEAKEASKAYADAQDEQQKTTIKAYADGKVTEEEQRAINDANTKLRLAKEYAQAQDELVTTQIKAYADGKITEAEQRAIEVAKAQAQLAKDTAEAHADNIVTEEERKRIEADKQKLVEAKSHAQELVSNIRVGGRNLMRDSESPIFYRMYGATVTTTYDFEVEEWDTNKAVRQQITGGKNDLRALIPIGVIPDGEIRSLSFYVKNLKNEELYFYSNHGGISTIIPPLGIERVKWEGIEGNGRSVLQIQCRTENADFAIWRINFEESNIASSWKPAVEDVQKEIQDAKDSVETLDTYVNGALKDNILDISEAKAIKKQAITQKERVLSTFNHLYQSYTFTQQDNARITNSKNSYLSAFDALLREIDKAISDSHTTANVESKFNDYKDKYAEFLGISIGIVNAKVFDTWKSIRSANESVKALNTEIKGAFQDGIIEKAEAIAIEKQINVIKTQEKSVVGIYEDAKSKLPSSSPLVAKLDSAKGNYTSKLNDLISSINSAISDGRTTPSEKSNVDSKYNVYKIAYAKLTEVLQQISDDKINNLQIGTRNLFKKSYVRDWSPEEFYDKELEGFTAKVKASNIIFTNNRGFGRIDFKENQSYSFYLKIKNSSNREGFFFITYKDGSGSVETTIKPNAITEVKLSTATNKSISTVEIIVSGVYLEITDITVVEGSVPPSSYIPTDEDVRMGVRNYLLNSNKFPITVGKSSGIILTDVIDAVQFERNGNGRNDAIRLHDYFDKSQLEKLRGKDCYFAFDLKVVQGTLKAPNLRISSSVDKECKPVTGQIKKGKWIRVYTPFNYDGSSFNLELNVSKLRGTYQVKNFQVSKGSNPTFDWKPALEDYEKAVQAVADKTDFLHKAVTDGPVVATGTLMVGNATGANAGITGVNEIGKSAKKSVRFFAGSNFINKPTAPFRVLENGELYASKAHISGEIEATSGTIGGFDITEYDIRSGGNDGTGVSLAPTNIIYRDGNDVFAGIGSNVMPAVFGVRGLQRLEYDGDATEAIGLYIKVKPKGTDLTGSSVRRALHIIGNNYQVGSSAIFETEYIGESKSGIVIDKLSRTHTYIFTRRIGDGYVFLPNKSQISEVTYGEPNITFELTFIVAEHCGNITIRGVSDGVLLDNDANPWQGGNGYMELWEGDTLKLRYCNGYYYIISHYR